MSLAKRDPKCEIAFVGKLSVVLTLTTHAHRKVSADVPFPNASKPICVPTGSTHPNMGVSEGTARGQTGDFHLLTNQDGNRCGGRRCVYRPRRRRDVVG